jgi:cytochrome b6
MLKVSGKLRAWFDDRYHLDSIKKFMAEKSVPVHRGSMWYYFGGVSLFLFIIQVVTGILLLMYYKGTEASAYESVQFIVSKVRFGWLIRSVHSWSANLMVLSAFIHMFSVFFTKAHRRPRELTWITGMLLLFLALFFGFSGYLLPWNTLAFFATKVGTEIAGVFPVVGGFILQLLRAGEDVTGATLSRFFGLHVALLPGIFTVVLAVHLLFVQRQGISEPEEWSALPESQKKRMPFFPNFILRDLLLWLIVLNILAVLAVFFPWELGQKADPFAPAPAGIKPEWYFVFAFQTLKLIPAKILWFDGELIGVLGFGVIGLLWLLVPLWDRGKASGRRNRLINYVGIVAVSFILIMTILGYMM